MKKRNSAFRAMLLSVAIVSASCGGCSEDGSKTTGPECGDQVCDRNASCTSDGCACVPGYTGDGVNCTATVISCEDSAECSDECSGGQCICDEGYELPDCTDIDECARELDDCPEEAVCTNTEGSFTCTCDGEPCSTTDECAAGAQCPGEHAACIDLPVGYECGCEDGYTKVGDACVALVDCQNDASACDENATCTDTPDGSACVCNGGFGGDGASCVRTAFEALAVSPGRTCGIRPGGKLECWGRHAPGANGVALLWGSGDPTPEPTGASWNALDVGQAQVCAVRADGTLWCFTGQDPPIQVGIDADWLDVKFSFDGMNGTYCGRATDQTLYCWSATDGTADEPVSVDEDQWISYDADTGWKCGVKAEGSLWCWGSPDGSTQIDEPQRVGTDMDWAEVRLHMPSPGAENTTIARKTDGSVYRSERGGSPDKVSDDAWASFDAYLYAECGVKMDGTLWCRGQDYYGLPGSPPPTNQMVFNQVGSDANWSEVWSADLHLCAMRNSGDVYCWGYNRLGELGTETPFISEPRLILPGQSFVQVSTGDQHSCAVRDDGALLCTGANTGTALLVPTNQTGFGYPTFTQVDSGPWTTVSAGNLRTCGIKSGELFCAGSGPGLNPNASSGTRIGDFDDWHTVEAGWGVTCGIRDGGAMFCWGFNEAGQLGLGDTDQRDAPEQVPGEWVSVSPGQSAGQHTCGIQAGGGLFCWGSNSAGELGTGDTTSSSVPVQVEGDWLAVSTGPRRTMGIKLDGTLWEWGTYTTQVLTPQQIGSDDDWKSVKTSNIASCGLKQDNTLHCWGSALHGIPGEPPLPQTIIDSPTQVGTFDDWSRISSVTTGVCALRASGALYCWGHDENGELGIGAAWTSSPQRVE